MKNQLLSCLTIAALSVLAVSCGKSKSSSKSGASNGQLVGAAYGAKQNNNTHLGMVMIPQGTFHMGPSDEDINYAYIPAMRILTTLTQHVTARYLSADFGWMQRRLPTANTNSLCLR